ncbi:MAG TPA: hypothetical protein VM680_11130 [Verrucomicrobiae bacterium]|nr:hypothetical protein [Verrucomicrobiae bacterium]
MQMRAGNLRNAVGSAVCQQLIVFSIALALLDGGVIAQICAFAAVAFWMGVAIIYFRHRGTLSKVDLLFIEAGTVPLIVAAGFLAFAIWRARGVLAL